MRNFWKKQTESLKWEYSRRVDETTQPLEPPQILVAVKPSGAEEHIGGPYSTNRDKLSAKKQVQDVLTQRCPLTVRADKKYERIIPYEILQTWIFEFRDDPTPQTDPDHPATDPGTPDSGHWS